MNKLKQKEVWVEIKEGEPHPSDFLHTFNYQTKNTGPHLQKQSGYFLTEQELKEIFDKLMQEGANFYTDYDTAIPFTIFKKRTIDNLLNQ